MYGSPLVTTGRSGQSVIATCTSVAGMPSHFATATACEVDMPVPISAAVCCRPILPSALNSTFANEVSAPVPKSFCTHAKPTP